MKKYAFFFTLLSLFSCKTAQKGYFYSHQAAEFSVKETAINIPVFTSIEAIPNASSILEMSPKNEPILIENQPLQLAESPRFSKKRQLIRLVLLNKKSLIQSSVESSKKPLSRTLSASYVALSFVLLSVLAMILLGNIGTYAIVFGIIMLALAAFFGFKGIRASKRK
jgi:small-conductance mechanosensitive channel